MLIRAALTAAVLAFPMGGPLDEDDETDGEPNIVEPEPAHTEPAPKEKPAFEAPTSLAEFNVRHRASIKERDEARRAHQWDTAREINEQVQALEYWYATKTQMHDKGLFAGGVGMVGIGGLMLPLGILLVATGTNSVNGSDLAGATGAVLTAISVVMLAVGIPFAAWGGRREMRSQPTMSFGPLGLQGTF